MSLCCVDKARGAFTWLKGLEHVGCETSTFVVDICSLEGDDFASCVGCQLYKFSPHKLYKEDIPASVTKRFLVAWLLRTVLPLKTVTVSDPVLVTATVAMWSVISTISTERGQPAMVTPARAATESIFEIIILR